MKYAIINGLLLYDDGTPQIKKENIYIDGGVITRVGQECEEDLSAFSVIDASDKLIIPGLINAHTHSYMSIMKNSSDDMPLDRWLNDRIFPLEAKMQGRDFYWATLLGCMEMIKSGTTCFLDMYIKSGACAEALCDSGMRAFTGRCITGDDLYADAKDDFSQAIAEKEEYENELVKFVLSPHSVYACSERLISQIQNESEKRKMLKHIHLSESRKEVSDCISSCGKTPVELLDDIGFLDSMTISAHCVHPERDDIDILAKNKVSVCVNASSNAKLGNGVAPFGKMLEKGINLCIGTDSAASNNSLDMFREMSTLSLINKASAQDAAALPARKVLGCATKNPAKALGKENKLGVIKQGAAADLTFINLRDSSVFPANDLCSALVYSADGRAVDSVMINGSFVMKNRELTTIDCERVCYEISRIAKKLFSEG